jgi:hypothetical protein
MTKVTGIHLSVAAALHVPFEEDLASLTKHTPKSNKTKQLDDAYKKLRSFCKDQQPLTTKLPKATNTKRKTKYTR